MNDAARSLAAKNDAKLNEIVAVLKDWEHTFEKEFENGASIFQQKNGNTMLVWGSLATVVALAIAVFMQPRAKTA